MNDDANVQPVRVRLLCHYPQWQCGVPHQLAASTVCCTAPSLGEINDIRDVLLHHCYHAQHTTVQCKQLQSSLQCHFLLQQVGKLVLMVAEAGQAQAHDTTAMNSHAGKSLCKAAAAAAGNSAPMPLLLAGRQQAHLQVMAVNRALLSTSPQALALQLPGE